MRIFLDANIIFSAAKSDGAIRELLRRLKAGDHKLIADAYVAEEARRNIVAKYPEAKPMLEQILGDLVDMHQIRRHATALDVDLPEKDRPVLGAAIGCNCDVLLTGDSTHFGALYGVSVTETLILSPRLLADRLFGNPQ